MSIDHELRDALRRKQAPPDLASRVLARIEQGEALSKQGEAPGKQGSSPDKTSARLNAQGPDATLLRSGSTGSTIRRWLAAAAVLAVAAAGGERYYTQHQAAETARVKEEIRLALQITNDTLARVQSKLSQPADNEGR